MAWFATAMVVMAAVCVVGLFVDDRVLLGAPIWMKPLKFATSMAVYCLTWSWMFSLLSKGRRVGYWASTAIVAFLATEYAVIVAQVARGRPSHFNVSTPVDTALWTTMTAAIAALWVGALVLTILVIRAPIAQPASRWAIRLGASISLVGLALGLLMTSTTREHTGAIGDGTVARMRGAHSVAVPDGGPGMAVTGWSTSGGDLRIPHFVGMHALQALPLLAILLEVLARRAPRLEPQVRTHLIVIAATAYAGMLALLTWQAERGQPLIRPDALTLTALAVLLAATVTACLYALRRPARRLSPAPDAHEAVPA